MHTTPFQFCILQRLPRIILWKLLQELTMYFQEEVWEVGAQLLGLSIGVLIMVLSLLFDLFIFNVFPVCQSCLSSVSALRELLPSFFWSNSCFFFLFQDTTGVKSSYETLMLTWLSVRLLHLWLRYQSLTVLKFRTVRCLTWSYVLLGLNEMA